MHVGMDEASTPRNIQGMASLDFAKHTPVFPIKGHVQVQLFPVVVVAEFPLLEIRYLLDEVVEACSPQCAILEHFHFSIAYRIAYTSEWKQFHEAFDYELCSLVSTPEQIKIDKHCIVLVLDDHIGDIRNRMDNMVFNP